MVTRAMVSELVVEVRDHLSTFFRRQKVERIFVWARGSTGAPLALDFVRPDAVQAAPELPPKLRSKPKTERLEARVATDLKARLCRDAALEGRTLTEFVTDHLEQAARKTIGSWERWEPGQRDREEFVRALLEPPEPNQALVEAVRRDRGQVPS